MRSPALKSIVRRAPLRGLTAEKKVGSSGADFPPRLNSGAIIGEFVIENLLFGVVDLLEGIVKERSKNGSCRTLN